MSKTIDYESVSYVVASRYRVDVVQTLDGDLGTPSGIANHTESDIAHVSRALQQLREKGLVDLMVDESTKKGRLYGLTDDGRDIVEPVSSVTNGDGS